MNGKGHSFAAGFSLVEVLCAIFILGVGMVGLTHGLTTALSSSKESELQTTAALLAAGRLETLRAEDFLTDGTEEGEGGEGFSQFHWEQSISATEIDGLHEVKVTIKRTKPDQVIYELSTLLFQTPSSTPEERTENRKSDSNSRKKERRTR